MKISTLILGFVGLLLLLFIGYAIVALPFKITLIVIIGFILAVLTILNLRIGLYFLIFVVPFTQQLSLGRLAFSPIDIGTDDALIIVIILSWLAGLARRKEPLILKTPLNWPLITFFSVAVFSFIGAYTNFGQRVALIGFLHLLKFFEYVVIYFIVVSAIENMDQVKKLLIMCFAVVGAIVIVHFSAIIRWGHFSLQGAPPTDNIFYMQTMNAFTSNAILGVYYSFFLAILLSLLLDTPVAKGKVPLTLFAAIISFALFNTYSRSSYLGLMCSFVVMGLLKEKRFFLVVLLFIFLSPIYMQSAVLERITFTVQAIKPTIVFDESSAVRLQLWQQGLKVFFDNLLIGTGYWTTRYALGGYEAHSQYVALLVETGIIGFSVFCWLIVRMFKNALNLLRKADSVFLKSLGIGYAAGLAAILVTCFFSETLEAFRMVGPLWFVTGLITSANRLLSKEKKEVDIDGS